MEVVSIVKRDYFELTMRAGLEHTRTLEHLMALVENAIDRLKNVIESVGQDNQEDIKCYIQHNVEKLDVYIDLTQHQLYEFEKMLKRDLE